MEPTVEIIKKHLKFAGAPLVNIKAGTPNEDAPVLLAVDYIIDIAGLSRGVPESTLIHNVNNQHRVSGSDRVLFYPTDSFDQALEILKQFSFAFNHDLTKEDISRLRRNQDHADQYLVFIIERPFFR
jgi:hypothetical protein